MKHIYLLFIALILGCSKDDNNEGNIIYRYEFECVQCSVTYTAGNGSTKTENISGKVSRSVNFTIDVDITIYVTLPAGNTEMSYVTIYRNNDFVGHKEGSSSYITGYRYSGGSSGGSTNGCGSYNGRTLHIGPKGGCYYINKNGNQTYVDRSYCRC